MKETILRELSGYISGQVSLDSFEEWILSHLQETLDSGDQEAVAIVDEIDALLMQLGQNEISVLDFYKLVTGIQQSANTITLTVNFAPDVRVISCEQSEQTGNITLGSEPEAVLVFGSGIAP